MEMMVVLVIIGVILTLATLSLPRPSPHDEIERQAARLAVLLQLARDEAMLRSREMGLRADAEELQFLILDDEGWEVLQDDVLRPRRWDEDTRAELVVEGFATERESPGRERGEEIQPQVLLASSGEMTPFELVLTSRTRRLGAWEIHGTASGRVTVRAPDAPP